MHISQSRTQFLAYVAIEEKYFFVEFLASFWKCLSVCQLLHVMIVVTLRVIVQAKGSVSD